MNMKIVLKPQNASEIAQELFRRLIARRFTYTIYDGRDRITERRTNSQLREIEYPIGYSGLPIDDQEFSAIITFLLPNQKFVMCHSSKQKPTKFDFTAQNGDIVIHSYDHKNICFKLKIEIENKE